MIKYNPIKKGIEVVPKLDNVICTHSNFCATFFFAIFFQCCYSFLVYTTLISLVKCCCCLPGGYLRRDFIESFSPCLQRFVIANSFIVRVLDGGKSVVKQIKRVIEPVKAIVSK